MADASPNVRLAVLSICLPVSHDKIASRSCLSVLLSLKADPISDAMYDACFSVHSLPPPTVALLWNFAIMVFGGHGRSLRLNCEYMSVTMCDLQSLEYVLLDFSLNVGIIAIMIGRTFGLKIARAPMRLIRGWGSQANNINVIISSVILFG